MNSKHLLSVRSRAQPWQCNLIWRHALHGRSGWDGLCPTGTAPPERPRHRQGETEQADKPDEPAG
jgi:hypothetical protein